ncbi:MAG TPA: hypothetical protein VJS30_14410 [Paraburkholderia sp.]|nr:hypothetical protein [Paraburkholderia sp.]
MHDKAHDKAHDKTHDKTHDRYFVYVSNAYDGEIAVLHLDAARGALTLASRCAGGQGANWIEIVAAPGADAANTVNAPEAS